MEEQLGFRWLGVWRSGKSVSVNQGCFATVARANGSEACQGAILDVAKAPPL